MKTLEEIQQAGAEAIRDAAPVPPVNLRCEQDPYPHLCDDEGCILARDYFHAGKVRFILDAVGAAVVK